MKATLIIITVVVVLLLVWINSPQRPAHQDDTPSMEVAAIEASYTLQDVYNLGNLHLEEASAAYRYEDLQLYPVFASQIFVRHHQRLGPYRSLQEAMEKKQIVITELSDDGDPAIDTTATEAGIDQAQVNKLFIENISSDTIIVLGGEVVRGGKQDRMIAQDFMVMPHSGKIDVDVYCVEHGRWVPAEGEALSFSVAMDVAPNRVRKATKEAAPQYKVWEEVAEIHSDLKMPEKTGALYDAVTNADMETSVKPYKEHLGKIQWAENVVGVIAVMGDEVVGCDIFAQNELFKKYYSSLLSSYCGDVYEKEKKEMMKYEEVEKFLQKVVGSKEGVDGYVRENGTQLMNGKYRIHVAAF